jgi:hypothetical protein
MNLFAAVRSAAASVAEWARFVSIDDARLQDLAEQLVPDLETASEDPAHIRLDSDDETVAFVVTLDAVNFGSGWFPVLHKPEGRSGYFTLATALRRHFERHGAFSAGELEAITPEACTRLFGQDPANDEVAELMRFFARSLSDLGSMLRERCGGTFRGLLDLAGGRAAELVALLAEMPLYRDVCQYGSLEVPLYKRAQITAADLALAFDESGPGRFNDLDELTMFADNLVPHVLRCEGVLRYAPSLAERIDAGDLLVPGSPEEVEIRAVGLHAVERMARHLSPGVAARALDRVLWSLGQSPRIKAMNRHRARSVFY